MRLSIWLGLLVAAGWSSSAWAEALSIERQIEIIENYQYVTGQATRGQAAAIEVAYGVSSEAPLKCGTPAVVEFFHLRDKLDPALVKAMGVEDVSRPTYAPDSEYVYDSPAGHFKIHYAVTGGHRVYQATRDDNGNGVPDYVDATGRILDSVYSHIMDTLGYDPPPSDSFYDTVGRGDGRFDVYFSDLLGPYFGLTWIERTLPGQTYPMRVTTFMQLENDYQEMARYRNRPLDAVRVTCAHEFFHAVQFGIDATENEVDVTPDGQRVRPYWLEISAVWMEEEIYDDINDYYSYLDTFFVNPRVSIQKFDNVFDLHPYASTVFAVYLSERFGRDIIKDIWMRCGDNPGADFLYGTELELRRYLGGDGAIPAAFREFALWNYFTGYRSYDAPDDLGYDEKEAYPTIPDNEILEITRYPHFQEGSRNKRTPEHNSAAYLRLDHLYAMETDSAGIDTLRISTCRDGQSSPCSVFITVPVVIDDSLTFYIGIGSGKDLVPPQTCGLNVVFRMDSIPDSFIADQFFIPYVGPSQTSLAKLQIIDPVQYRSAVIVASPASWRWEAYLESPFWPAYLSERPDSFYDYTFSHAALEILDSARIGDTLIIVDTPFVSLPAAVLAPYPNPAVVREMDGAPVKFRFQIPTDRFSNYIYTQPSFSVDVFSLAGEFICDLDTLVTPHVHDKEVIFTTSWDMKNKRGEEVASGVYIAVGRIFATSKQTELVAEDRVKVAIIR